MKSLTQLFTVYAITLLAACTNLTSVPDILKEQTKGSEHESSPTITLRDQVDATLITNKPQIQYFKKGNEYTFICLYPTINTGTPADYQWNTKWTYLLKNKGGLMSQSGTSQLKLTPIDFLSVQVEVECYNVKTGIKSYPYSNGLVIDLTKSKSTIIIGKK